MSTAEPKPPYPGGTDEVDVVGAGGDRSNYYRNLVLEALAKVCMFRRCEGGRGERVERLNTELSSSRHPQ